MLTMLPQIGIIFVIYTACAASENGIVANVRVPRSASDAILSEVRDKNAKGIEKEYYLSLDMNLEWEQFILPAPLSVALMGQLVVLAAKQDFPLKKPAVPYKHIKYLYFRPTLIQVANEAWDAFEQANTNMNEIRLLSDSIPRYVKAIVKYLATGNAKVIYKFVPLTLQGISTASDKCSVLATAIDGKFESVMDLLGEVDEALAETKGGTDERLLNISKTLEEGKSEKKFLDNIYEESKKQFDKIQKQLEKDRSEYLEAVRKIPSGLKATLQGLVSKFSPSNIIGDVKRLFGHKRGGGGGGPGIGGVPGAYEGQSAKQALQDQLVLHFADNMYGTLESLPQSMSSVVDVISHRNKSEAESNLGQLKEMANAMALGINIIKNRVEAQNESRFTAEVTKDINAILKLTKNISDIPSHSPAATEMGEILANKDRLVEILQALKTLSAAKAFMTGSAGLMTQGPTNGGGSSGGDSARYIAAQRLQTLQENTRRFEIYYQQLKEANQDLTDIMAKISELKLDKVHQTEIQNILRQGLKQLSDFKRVWNLLINFFQMISGIANVTLKKNVQSFFDYTNTSLATGIGLDDPESTSVIRQSIQDEAIRVATVAKFLNSLAVTYTMVSQDYIMEPLTVLPGLQKIEDPSQQHAKLQQMFRDAEKAQIKTKTMVDDQKMKYEVDVRKQTADIQNVYSIVGKPTSDDLKAIEAGKKAAESTGPICLLDC